MFDVADVHTSTVRSKSGRRLPARRALRYRSRLTVDEVAAETRDKHLTDASRQVSATAQQIAAAAGTLADLAGNSKPPQQLQESATDHEKR